VDLLVEAAVRALGDSARLEQVLDLVAAQRWAEAFDVVKALVLASLSPHGKLLAALQAA